MTKSNKGELGETGSASAIGVTITGNIKVGNALTAMITASDGVLVSGQWTLDDDDIDGASFEGHTGIHVVSLAEVGHVIWCRAIIHGLSVPVPLILGDLTLSDTSFPAAAAGAVLATIEGGATNSQFSIDPSDTSGLFATDASGNLLAGSNYPADRPQIDEGVSVHLREINPDAINSPHTTTIDAIIEGIDVPAGFMTPGNQTYRQIAMIDPSTLEPMGDPNDTNYAAAGHAAWLSMQMSTETGVISRWLGAAKGVRVQDSAAGDLLGVDHIMARIGGGPWVRYEGDTEAMSPEGVMGFELKARARDFAASGCYSIEAIVYWKSGVPFIVEGRHAGGPAGQAPTYDTDAGPLLPVAGNTANMARQAFDARVFSTGPVNGGTKSSLCYMPGTPAMLVNVDTGDGHFRTEEFFCDPVNGARSNDGLTRATPVVDLDDIAAKAPARMTALFGKLSDGHGNSWDDVGGVVVNMMAGNHSIGCSTAINILPCADNWITVQADPQAALGSVSATSNKTYSFFAEKARVGPGFALKNCTWLRAHPNESSRNHLYADFQWDGATANSTAGGFITSGQVATDTFTANGKTQGTAALMTLTDGALTQGMTASITVTPPIHGAGMTFTPVLNNGQVESVIAAGSMTQNYQQDDVITFTDATGKVQTGTINIVYGLQPAGVPAIGFTSSLVCGRFEVRGRAGVDTFTNHSSPSIWMVSTFVANVTLNGAASNPDLIGNSKTILNFRAKNCWGWANPMYARAGQLCNQPQFNISSSSWGELGNHFDCLQPFSKMDGFYVDGLDYTGSNCQGIFADANAPFANGVFRNVSPANGPPLTGLTSWAWGAGGENVAIINPKINGGSGYATAYSHKNITVLLQDDDTSIPWAGQWEPGVRLIYPTTTVEPIISLPIMTDWDAAAPGNIVEAFDAELLGLMHVTNRGPSGQTRLRLDQFRDAKNPSTNCCQRLANTTDGYGEGDFRRPTITLGGFNGRPCLSFTGNNTGDINDDYCLGNSSTSGAYMPLPGSVRGVNPVEVWTIMDNEHPSVHPGSTTKTWFWAQGGASHYYAGGLSLWRQFNSGKEHLYCGMGISNSAADNSSNSIVAIDTTIAKDLVTGAAPVGGFSGPMIVVMECLTTQFKLTVYNANNPNGVQTVAPAFMSGYFKNVNGGRCTMGACNTVNYGDPNTYTKHNLNARVTFNPLPSDQRAAVLAAARQRCGF